MQPRRDTLADYLALEAESDVKHEFWHGEIVAMAGADPVHNRITFDTARAIDRRVEDRGCDIFVADQRVQLNERYVYPDIVILCEEPVFVEPHPRSLVNPAFIVEVISESTADRDRGEKLSAYTKLESLQEYWIVEQTEPRVFQYFRGDGMWHLRVVEGLDAAIDSAYFDLVVPMADLYRRVSFETA